MGRTEARVAPTLSPAAGERFTVEGVVQGVGYRPFVYRLANELGVGGFVGNDSTSVFIDAYGPTELLDLFAARLVDEAPPLARVDHVERQTISADTTGDADTTDRTSFAIVDSRSAAGPRTIVPPDTAVCADCLRELFDPADRRYRHPFITCTNCGPRFTIVAGLPYDRPNTTMAGFAMCATCEAEYRDPTDRRYHAQPIACHDCGPRLSFTTDGEVATQTDPIAAAVEVLDAGGIVAIKGLGGYHLACDATNDDAVEELRRRKRRAEKPFAVMVADLDHARELAEFTDAEAALLASPAAPIVLLPARRTASLSALVAPENPLVGIVLPYTPIHHLLLTARSAPLVMTSANFGGEPIAWDRPGLDRCVSLADGVIDHDRPIQLPCDDSVSRMVGDRLLPIRRARGYAPVPVALPSAARPVLAVGGELKNTFCLAANGFAWVGQHIGDMANVATLEAFSAGVAQFAELYDVTPGVVAADAHPDYLSSNWARNHHRERVLEVQHHHAHVAAVMAEHQLPPDEPVLGFAFDGTGYGNDDTIWGGELLVASASGFDRAAHLAPVALPGGDAAVRAPARVALAHLHAAGQDWHPDLAPVANYTDAVLQLLRRQLDLGVACVATTSMGRLFDAVASLVGLRQEISFEAQAAIDLEIAAQRSIDTVSVDTVSGDTVSGDSEKDRYRFLIDDRAVQSGPVIAAIVEDVHAEIAPGTIAARFHHAVADVVERLAVTTRADTGITTVVLSGGVFQNALLTQLCVGRLGQRGFDVRTHTLVPPNDGGLSLGQAYIASHSSPSQANPTLTRR
ncbi:MAG: carbamoyltransferase HypF [Acidimicrobiales bacterium]